jgi:hypothetical protein
LGGVLVGANAARRKIAIDPLRSCPAAKAEIPALAELR